MKQLRSGSHAISGAFVFLLLGIFAVFAVLMTALSAQLYRSTVSAAQAHNDQRVLVNYLANTIHAGDQANAFSVVQEAGVDMLVIHWPSDDPQDADAAYETRIYCQNGSLYELLMDCGAEFTPQEGSLICRVQSFVPALNGSLLTITYTDHAGVTGVLHIHLCCTEEQGVST